MLAMTTDSRRDSGSDSGNDSGNPHDSAGSSGAADLPAALLALPVDVTAVAGRPGASRGFERHAVVAGLATEAAGVGDDPVDLDLRLEGVAEGVVVNGSVGGAWHAECSRCLEPIQGPFDLEVHELYEVDPVDGETYLLADDEIDLVPLVRDTVVPRLPHAPICADDCRGLCPRCGVDRNHEECDCAETVADPRWDALDELRFDEPRFNELRFEER